MNALLYRVIDLLGRRRAFASWAVALMCGLLLVGGIVIGATGPAAPADAGFASDASIASPAPTVQAGQSAVLGTIVAVRPRGVVVLTGKRQRVVVQLDRTSVVRKNGKRVARTELRAGLRVVVLGKVGDNGQMQGRTIAIRGEVQKAATPVPSATPTPLQ